MSSGRAVAASRGADFPGGGASSPSPGASSSPVCSDLAGAGPTRLQPSSLAFRVRLPVEQDNGYFEDPVGPPRQQSPTAVSSWGSVPCHPHHSKPAIHKPCQDFQTCGEGFSSSLGGLLGFDVSKSATSDGIRSSQTLLSDPLQRIPCSEKMKWLADGPSSLQQKFNSSAAVNANSAIFHPPATGGTDSGPSGQL
jgi:hypothetical protein